MKVIYFVKKWSFWLESLLLRLLRSSKLVWSFQLSARIYIYLWLDHKNDTKVIKVIPFDQKVLLLIKKWLLWAMKVFKVDLYMFNLIHDLYQCINWWYESLESDLLDTKVILLIKKCYFWSKSDSYEVWSYIDSI